MSGRKVIKSSVIVMLLIIGGKILALVRDALIAEKFGATYVTDIYNFSLGFVYLLTTISYGLTTTFIPLNSDHIENSSSEKRNKFVNNIINLSAFFTIIITVILIVFSKQIIYLFGHGFTANMNIYSQSVEIIRIMLLSLIFVTLQSVVTGVLQSHKRFYEPAAMALASNMVYIIYLVFLTAKYGMKGFAVATVIGFFVQLAINIPGYRKLGYRYRFVMDIKDSDALSMFKLMVPIVISTSLIQLNLFVNRSFANNIYFGAVTVLDYSNKVSTLAYEVFAIGIAMIVYPTLSELAVKKDIAKYRKALVNSINTIMIIMIPAAVAIGILRHPLINVIFRRGAFSLEASNLTSSALLFYCPAMIAYGIRDILNKAFYSIKDAKTPMVNSFTGIVINVIINFALIKYMKVSGLALATTISAIITTMFMMANLNKKLNGMNMKKLFGGFLKISFSSAVMGACIYAVNYICMNEFSSFMKGSIMSIFASFVAGSAVYFICLHLTGIEEYEYVVKAVKNKISM
ncbi:murein biosynthesis integral membrane protein MurJ [Clostridium luticellarii]|jgi:putative peptidoglycan lipid II flippase|uniref:Probable lipid II flippase MurJ n=1 Tax=Clostridium luticellarii TaxID=1691940 RepID=A0A2T0BQZ8_9CLOT|nr:murein biosynthesis integral membrane protein MurJ [Clostridium luticellarii]MCI1944319.1 murein biosynthesis integral membrane protein MurJ [Clostridium luticellarii]MCI1967815.1 murein biosynthesis integral membrane protein MurJ [Clostridium luticellarii]MCI1994693.1 murein biosynthesis integral membrane protein MurJ [Clostridium luticellarii]MCI2038810.1 murein biosynthesis integral membrane protein MurJ [Clostridium luticellarii]PRR86293.1 putative peptidoglycan biosynthesis protein Mur